MIVFKDCFHKCTNFNDFHFIEADMMPRFWAEITKEWMVWADQNRFLTIGGHFGIAVHFEQLEFAHPFLIKFNRTLGSCDFKAKVHFVTLT